MGESCRRAGVWRLEDRGVFEQRDYGYLRDFENQRCKRELWIVRDFELRA